MCGPRCDQEQEDAGGQSCDQEQEDAGKLGWHSIDELRGVEAVSRWRWAGWPLGTGA